MNASMVAIYFSGVAAFMLWMLLTHCFCTKNRGMDNLDLYVTLIGSVFSWLMLVIGIAYFTWLSFRAEDSEHLGRQG